MKSSNISLSSIARSLAEKGIEHEFVIAGDKRIGRKIAMAILKDKVGLREVKRIESELRREINKGDYERDVGVDKFSDLTSWFVRDYAKKNPEADIDSNTVSEVATVLCEDFERASSYVPDNNLAYAASNEADFYSSVVFGHGRSGSDAFLSFLRALRPFMIFGLRDFKQAENGNWFARGRYVVIEFGNTDPRDLLKGKGQIRVNYIKATTPSQEWENKFDKLLREFTDSFQKKDAVRVTAAVSEEENEDRDSKYRSLKVRLGKAGIAFSAVINKDRVKLVVKKKFELGLKVLSKILVEAGWKKTKSEDGSVTFAKGDIRATVSKGKTEVSTLVRIRHKNAVDWASRTAKKKESGNSSDHNNVPPSYMGLVKLPSVFKKAGSFHAVKFQGRRVYFYKPVKISVAKLEKILQASPVGVNAYVRSGKVEIVAVYDAKTKKPFVRTASKKKTAKKAA